MKWYINWSKAIELVLKIYKLLIEVTLNAFPLELKCYSCLCKRNVINFIYSAYMFKLSKYRYLKAVWLDLDAIYAKINKLLA